MIRIFRVSIPASILLLVVSETILLAGCFLMGALFSLDALVDPWFYFRFDYGWAQLLFVVSTIQFGLYFMDLYDNPFPRSTMVLIQQLCVLLGVAFLMQAIVGYGEFTILQFPQWTMVYGSVFTIVTIPLWRLAFAALVRKAIPGHSLLFLELPPESRDIAERLTKRPEMGYRVLGYLGAESCDSSIRYLGCLDELEATVASLQPDTVVVTLAATDPLPELLDLRLAGVDVQHVSMLYEEVFGRVSLAYLQSQLAFWPEFSPRRWTLRAQSIYSYFLGLAGLILFSPMLLIGAIMVKVSSRGPILYRQQRVGRRGVPFFVYKFRSMYVDAEASTGPVWAGKDDPRITPIGRWMRRMRLDELPQFFNVLRGDMAVVGPRPERPEFCAILKEKLPFYHQRHMVKPGITGWAQINLEYTDNIEDSGTKLEYDLYYIKHLAPALDAYIIFHTVKVMLLSRGAR